MIFRIFGKKLNKRSPVPDADAIIAEMRARTGIATRAAELPAWALLFRSPFRTYGPPTSWLGGVPLAPEHFQWPLGDDGKPLYFIAQIDLSALRPEPTTGARAPGLPTEGALLIFIGETYAIRILTQQEADLGKPVTPPRDLPDLEEFGFWGQGNVFNCWAVDPVAYLSRGEDRPDFLPDPCRTPSQWITNWGIAALEVSILIDAMQNELKHQRDFLDHRKKLVSEGKSPPMKPHIEQRLRHCELMEEQGRKLLAALRKWHEKVSAMPPDAAVDQAALGAIFAERIKLSEKMEANFGSRHLLASTAQQVWQGLVEEASQNAAHPDFSKVPQYLRSFAESRITDWRGHRLFGLEPEFPNNSEDMRGQDPVISVHSDPLLGTQSEHNYGFSIWLDRERMAQRQYENGQLIHHCAV